MISRRRMVLSVLSGLSLLSGSLAVVASPPRSRLMRSLDTDNDGTLDLSEAKKAAEAVFNRLDRDHDGTLNARELRRRMSAKEFAASDPDKDGTLTKDEYLAIVEQRFKAADRDNDGTLTPRELISRPGRALLRLIK